MPLSFVDLHEGLVAVRVGRTKSFQGSAVVGADLGPVVGGVEGAHLKREGDIPHRLERDAVGVARHHRRRRPVVGHPGGELIDAVAAGRIAEDKDAIRIDLPCDHQILDEAVEEPVDVGFVPEIPGVCRGPGGDVDPLVDGVELFLVFPLLIVDARRSPAAAMKRDPEGMPPRGLLAKGLQEERHDKVAVAELAGLDLCLALGALFSSMGLPEEIAGGEGIGFRQWHFRPRSLRHAFKRHPGLGEGPPERFEGLRRFRRVRGLGARDRARDRPGDKKPGDTRHKQAQNARPTHRFFSRSHFLIFD